MSEAPKRYNEVLAYAQHKAAAFARKKLPPQEGRADDSLLAETDHFYAIVGKGALTPGYVLLLPKTTCASFAALDADLSEEAAWFTQSLATLLAETYQAPIVKFEHGLAEDGGEPAHLHMIPLAPGTGKEDVIHAIDATLHERAIGIKAVTTKRGSVLTNPCDMASMLSIVAPENIDGSLLQYSHIAIPEGATPTFPQKQQLVKTHGHYTHFEVPALGVEFLTHETLRSQASREICARALADKGKGHANEWHCDKFPHYENMAQTMHDLAPALAKLWVSGKGDQYGFKTHLIPARSNERINETPAAERQQRFG